MGKYIKFLVILLFSLTACQQDKEKKERDFFDNAIIEANIETNYQWIVVLSGLGCQGCIQEAEAFMREYVTNERILFVLTELSSLKIFQQKIGTLSFGFKSQEQRGNARTADNCKYFAEPNGYRKYRYL